MMPLETAALVFFVAIERADIDCFSTRPLVFEVRARVCEEEMGIISPKAAKAFVIILLLPAAFSSPGANATSKISLHHSSALSHGAEKLGNTYTVSPVDNCPSIFRSKRKVCAKPTTPTSPVASALKVTALLSRISSERNSFRKSVLNVLKPAKLMTVSFSLFRISDVLVIRPGIAR